MKTGAYICLLLVLTGILSNSAKAQIVRENNKWGFKKNDAFLIKPIYDTIFGYDSTNKVCLACQKDKTANANKFIKVTITKYLCHYYDAYGNKLMIRNQFNDTFTVFSRTKNSIAQYNNNSFFFTVAAKGRKYLLTKDFRQQTFNTYHEIRTCEEPMFYVAEQQNEFEQQLMGVVNTREDVIVPFSYTGISFNTDDSLIIACTGRNSLNAADDVYDYKGKRIATSPRHLEMATSKFLIQKIFEPKEQYIFLNLETKVETALTADVVQYYKGDEVAVKIKNDWYIYDLNTNQKRPKPKS